MPQSILRIEIETSDREFLKALRAEEITGLRLMSKVFTCDSAEWIPPVEKILTFIVDASTQIEIGLLSTWLYERFKNKPPERVTVNDQEVEPASISIVINNIQIHNSRDK